MKILITGGTGLLGKAIIETASSDYEIMATYFGSYEINDNKQVRYRKLNITDKSGCHELFNDFRPDVVIHAAGIGSPDFAEKNKEYTWKLNVSGTENIVDNCRKFSSKLIHVSSSCIYDGDRAPYKEEDIARPVHYYGRVKLEGENAVKKSGIDHAIVRPILCYGWNHPFERKNIITFALEELKKGKVINIYEDVFCNSIFVESCAEAIWQIIKRGVYEEFNVGGRDSLSLYQLVKIAAGLFNLDPHLVKPVRQGFFKELIRRPKDTTCKIDKIEKVLGVKPLSAKQGLGEMKVKAGKSYV